MSALMHQSEQLLKGNDLPLTNFNITFDLKPVIL